ncbi:hypothetical protein PsAD2_02093 [Pseudovibrio axinellae]|uniref:CAAX amino terminal protease self-immunity n=1 Tax=Pseudovibrio axinellae TaxID=989403 RepID=A0A165YY79_9HYPH|nr:hypothetical protein [Pseudovibrio axinellae]KZL19341.1 hypothetical protein PsAD2_02093 [Pseudovibrio axinellae]SEQ40580.1 hypothetical protein SAMN05421798_102614 [Pseudovibrio axinellae]
MSSPTQARYYPVSFRNQFFATVVWAQVFVLYCVALILFTKQDESHIFWADPFIKILPIYLSTALIILTSLCLGWWCFNKLGMRGLLQNTPVFQMVLGVAIAVLVTCAVWGVVGNTLPGFVPAEESARPGFLFGMIAGYGEELVFRMVLSALVFFGMFKSLSMLEYPHRVFWSATAAILVATLAFVFLHELGETDSVLVWGMVATRVVVPSFLMGALFFLVGPGFLIFLHATMHIMIPLLFV